ncbi:MAG: tRNA preQ1(34) S-adenosylmethionine ribosyltransferase-isomerase QueA [Phototrophicales bacterium]|nr:MAG: tRNA preQ1(34) S-adenosylmethionine ribosyltransferase-isomerase QueA [Phototrophicales bacterium]
MKLSDFDYTLPPELIAQEPIEPRDASRLLVLHRDTGQREHRIFRDIKGYLRPNDVLVLNQTRVIPARIYARKQETGGKAEILLLRHLQDNQWEAVVGGRRIVKGTTLELENSHITATIIGEGDEALRIVEFSEPITEYLTQAGDIPLPPYITKPLNNIERYQTVYAHAEGSAAAPTAGLHFTPELLIDIQRMGVKIAYCTLHVGLDTFGPVRVENIKEHKLHREYAQLSADDARLINEAKLAGGRVIAVGTTSTRTLETAAIRSAAFSTPHNDPSSVRRTLENIDDNMCGWRPVIAIEEETDLYITPGYRFRVVDALITNFHLPKTTLLMMISAFAGRELILETYQEAIEQRYRFYSFGDAMFIL